MSAIYPGETGLEGYWRTVSGGRDAITEVPPTHWLIDDYYDADPSVPDKTYCKRGGFIDPVPFDPVKFGIPPNALQTTDSAQILALIAAKQVLDKVTGGRDDVDLDRTDIILGVASTTELVVQAGARLQGPVWRKAMLENGLSEAEAEEISGDIAAHYPPWVESTFPGLLGNVVAGRVANRLNLGGCNFVIDAACASSLASLQSALHRLYLHEADTVITGGVDALNDVMMYMCFSKTPAFSKSGDIRPLSDGADGTLIGEGVGMVALKRLDDAERDGDDIYAVIRGIGSSSDGRASSVYAPRSEGQAKAVRAAYRNAGYEPTTIGLLEAHGTATKAGDAAEFAGLKSVFTDTDNRIAIGSVKSQIGHTKAAAGAAGLIKAILALQHSTLPGTLKVERPNPDMGIEETPFYINSTTRPWVRTDETPRRASVSSFGFGGTNFHVTLEQYEGKNQARRLRTLPTELVVLSGANEAELGARATAIIEQARGGESLARIAFEAAQEFDASQSARAALVADDTTVLTTLAEKLRTALADGKGAQLKDRNIFVGFGAPREGKTAFLFPGQGSHYIGMGADLALDFPEALEVWDGLTGDLADLHNAVYPEPAFDDETRAVQNNALTSMETAQPAIAAISLAQLALLDELGVKADAAAGHSFGEVTALAAAGVLPVDRLMETARTRGHLMAEAGSGKDATMLAIIAGADEVRALLDAQPETDGTLVIANDNGPRQVVVAGHIAEIENVERAAGEAGLRTKRLTVASAFHSPIVAESSAPFAEYLNTLPLGESHLTVYANATAQPYGDDPTAQLADQVRQSVRFREMIQAMAADGVTRFIEVGPGRVLTGLVNQILGDTPHLAVALDDPKVADLRGWHRGLAALAADGVSLDLVTLYDHYEEPAKFVAAPKYAVMVGGANVGKPYPPADGKVVITPKRKRTPLAAAAPTAVSAPVKSVAAQSVPAAPKPAPAAPAATPTRAVSAAPVAAAQPQRPPTPVPAAAESSTVTSQSQPASGAPAPRTASARAAAPADDAPLSMDAWSLIDRIQKETAAQHERYLDVVADSHQQFLDMSTRMLAEIVGDPASAAVVTPQRAASAAVQAPVVQAPAALVAPAPQPAPVVAAAPAVAPAAPVPVVVKPAPAPAPVAAPAPAAAAPIVPAPAAAPGKSASDVVLEIVSEKTGYPADMLGLEMEMEAELGIDSIKQVEILSALQAKYPGAPEIPGSELASMRTLQDVVNATSSFVSAAPAPAAALVAAAPAAAPGKSASDVVLEIVSEKTGYPADMLGLEMEMEAELGIDSIKQVEILSALQAQYPGAPEIPGSELASMRTLQDVVNSVAAFAAPATPAPAAQPAAAQPTGPTQSPSDVVLEIVSEKTGYPADMLGLEMEMEAELGIDSIKQVEILSALQSRYPGAPEIPGSELASMRTLQDVVNSIAGFDGGSATTAKAVAAASDSADFDATPTVGLSCTEAQLRVVPPAGFAMGGLQDGDVLITREDPAFADALERVLVTHGIKARAVDEVPDEAGAVISLAALGTVRTPDECVDMHVRAFHAARAVAKSSAASRVFVTIQATGGTFAGGDVPTGVASLVKTASWEWPNASVRAIDIEILDPERIAAELLAGGSGVEVALRADGTRLVAIDEVDATEVGETIPVPAEGVVVVTGGARGVTARSALALARRHGLRLALLGRTALAPESADEPAGTTATEIATALASSARARGESLTLPQARAAAEKLLAAREVRETLATAQRQGTVAQYFAADTTDRDALYASLEQVRHTLGPIVGLVHGAGVLADRRLEDLEDDGFLRVFRTKLIGAETLLAATSADELRFIALFSSIAARAGNPGQAAYASANAALDSIAAREARRRGDNCVVRAFGWGPWDGGMVDATLKSRFTEAGVGVIPIGEGAEFFARHALGRASATAVVVAAPAAPQLRSTTLAWDISVEAAPVLADHQVRGNVVIPVVFVLDAVLRAVRGLANADAPVIRDFRVLSGVTFPAGEQHALTIEVVADGAAYAVSIRDAGGRTRYSARVESGSATDLPVSVSAAGDRAWPFGVADAYAGPLFHGPAFQVIDQLTAFGAAGGSALLKVKGEAGWTGGAWSTDPAALDGALQLGILWASAQGMPLVLPVSVGRAVFTAPFPAEGEVQCRLAAFPLGDKRVDYDIVFETTDGAPIASLEGVEFYVAGNADGATA